MCNRGRCAADRLHNKIAMKMRENTKPMFNPLQVKARVIKADAPTQHF